MAKIYADRIKYKKVNPKTGLPYTIDDVPQKYREEVQRILDEE